MKANRYIVVEDFFFDFVLYRKNTVFYAGVENNRTYYTVFSSEGDYLDEISVDTFNKYTRLANTE